jgi:hypothetical protein
MAHLTTIRRIQRLGLTSKGSMMTSQHGEKEGKMTPLKNTVAATVETLGFPLPPTWVSALETSLPEKTQEAQRPTADYPPITPVANPCRTEWQQRWLALDVTCPQVQAMADAVERWCARMIRNNRNESLLVLAGRSGIGKTHAARNAVKYCNAADMWSLDNRHYPHPPATGFYHWPAISDGFKRGEFAIMEDLSALATDKLCQVLSRRERRHTIVTTNIEPEHWAAKFDARVADRFLRNSVILDLSKIDSYALREGGL